MSYQVIARKWRPQKFDDVVGQQAVTRTLRNALASRRLAQAFVFAGPRGVGKTTTARILARALNCVKGPTPDPCGACDACVEIAEGRDMDVLEIDAATHTQVENVREVIVSGLGIKPVRDRYKVFIIDEVHQLSNHSFNALARMRAVVVLPTPRGPANTNACASRLLASALRSVRVTACCPTTSSNFCGRHLRAMT